MNILRGWFGRLFHFRHISFSVSSGIHYAQDMKHAAAAGFRNIVSQGVTMELISAGHLHELMG
jgi:hypothetical protein